MYLRLLQRAIGFAENIVMAYLITVYSLYAGDIDYGYCSLAEK